MTQQGSKDEADVPNAMSDEASPLFNRVLVANRGEIAVRVIRACRELGIAPVAVYGPGEESSMHVRLADDAYRLEATAKLPYLDIEGIVAIAQRAGTQAIHPGYGFLAENADLAEACTAAGIVFIGPEPEATRTMGDKITARRIAAEAGVPVVPGSDGPVKSVAEASTWASRHGYPVAVKAAAGGGGRGFRVAHNEAELEEAFTGSSGEGARYFGDPVVYLERYLVRPRHIEVQLFADSHGNVVWLGERDCSVQRRHQKLIEETPSPFVDDALRRELGEAAGRLARQVNYTGAGTVEFMVTDDCEFYFLEMNTRIQVEHTVTEAVTGIDLVKEQIRVAAGERLSFSQADIEPRGHAIQCRINAEDAGAGFQPIPGQLATVRWPAGPGIRIDTAMEPGTSILPAYDSLIAKVIAWGRDREEAIARMKQALAETTIEGVPTTIPFHERVMRHPAFVRGEVATTFLEEYPETLPEPVAAKSEAPDDVENVMSMLVEVNGRRMSVRIHGDSPAVTEPKSGRAASVSRRRGSGSTNNNNANEVTSPLQGTVLRVMAEAGMTVEAGDVLCVIEAMKMENEVAAHRAGEIVSVEVEVGGMVSVGGVIARLS